MLATASTFSPTAVPTSPWASACRARRVPHPGHQSPVVARNGQVLRSFDPLFRSEALEQDGEPLPAEAGLDWDHQQSAMLAVLARLTDVRIGGSRWVPDGAELAAGT